MRLKLLNALCVMLRHPAAREEYAGGSARTRCPCGYIEIYDRAFVDVPRG